MNLIASDAFVDFSLSTEFAQVLHYNKGKLFDLDVFDDLVSGSIDQLAADRDKRVREAQQDGNSGAHRQHLTLCRTLSGHYAQRPFDVKAGTTRTRLHKTSGKKFRSNSVATPRRGVLLAAH
jgi:hypothetical protein